MSNCFALVGPIPGKPSRMYCFCSCNVLGIFVGLIEFVVLFLDAICIRVWAVCFVECVWKMGVLWWRVIERRSPLIVF